VREGGRRGGSEVSQRSDADGRAIRLAMSAISVTQFRRADASIAPRAEHARARARTVSRNRIARAASATRRNQRCKLMPETANAIILPDQLCNRKARAVGNPIRTLRA